jgi:hypothetical protein
MNKIESSLAILFVILIYAIIFKKLDLSNLIPVGSLLFVIIWIFGDSLSQKRRPRRERRPRQEQRPADHYQIKSLDDSIQNKVNKALTESKLERKESVQEKKEMTQPARLEYSENNYKNNIFDEIGSMGDNNIAHLMKHMSNKNRVAIDNMSRQNKYTNINYLAAELDEHANSIWWDDETLEDEF